VSHWTDIFLGVIAFASLAIAIVHLAVLVAAGLVARRLGRLADRVERELGPVFEHIQTVGREAARAAALATAQVERADRLFTDVGQRVEQSVAAVQAGLGARARKGRAVVTAFRAGFRALTDLRGHSRSRPRGDDEDALFI
jgi:hypothetical protein